MKQIRRGVFETNSSSTHSMQITNKDNYIEIILHYLMQSYKHVVEDDCSGSCLDEGEYLRVNKEDGTKTLTLKGFDMVNGEESAMVFGVVKSAIGKLQYFYMLLNNYRSDYRDIKGISYDDNYIFEPLEVLKECAKIYYEKQGEKIKEVIAEDYYNSVKRYYSEDYTVWFDEYGEDLFGDIITDNEKIKEVIDEFLYNDDKVILYKDFAYSPYDKPEFRAY